MKFSEGRKMLGTLAALMSITIFFSCSARQVEQEPEPLRPTREYVDPDTKYVIKEVFDPWEGFNRNAYKFNAKFDKHVHWPVVKTYRFLFPSFVRTGVSNFFNNIGELDTFVNSLLQLKFRKTGITLGRIGLNTLWGVGGLIDVATPLGLDRQDEDFGQTFGHYGAGSGPFLVIPVLGPSNLRDAGGLATEAALFFVADPFNFSTNEVLGWSYTGAYAIDARHQIDFRYYQSGSPFEYELIRLLYSRGRKLLIDN